MEPKPDLELPRDAAARVAADFDREMLATAERRKGQQDGASSTGKPSGIARRTN